MREPVFIRPIRLAAVLWLLCLFIAVRASSGEDSFMEVIRRLSSVGDRSTGTPGCDSAGEYLAEQFKEVGLQEIGAQRFFLPVLTHEKSDLILPGTASPLPLHPLRANALSPGTIGPQGITGPLIYAGRGALRELNGKDIRGSVVVMELDSGKNWLHAANLGASAAIYVDRGNLDRMFFEEKLELSPIDFPRFRVPAETAERVFGPLDAASSGVLASRATLRSDVRWALKEGKNHYGLIPGTDPALAGELILVEAFYDSTAHVPGLSPGADEAAGAATLLALGRYFKDHPPGRSILLMATSGHAQSLYGMREMIWSLRSKSETLKREGERLKEIKHQAEDRVRILERATEGAGTPDPRILADPLFNQALQDALKTEADAVSRRLIALRMMAEPPRKEIRSLAGKRLILRRLGWKPAFVDLSPEEEDGVTALIPRARAFHTAVAKDAGRRLSALAGTRDIRSVVKEKDLAAVVSLHLSTHGQGVGGFSDGWLYRLKPAANRMAPYAVMDDVMRTAPDPAAEETVPYHDTLRPSALHPWQGFFPDQPALGGEVSALAGYLGVTLATVHDGRRWWGTPYDLPERMDRDYAERQSLRVCSLISALAWAPTVSAGSVPKNGFAAVTGRVRLMRHGELFPDQAASGVTILAYQGPGRYHALTDALGTFSIKGVASKNLMPDKLILEGCRFDPETGEAVWAIDKKQTGKDAYRLKVQRQAMETELVMFPARQTTLFHLLEPRTFRYMNRLELLDGRREAPPLRYGYSRIDTRSSTLTSIYLEPGTHLKLTHSDTLLERKMVLVNADETHPDGTGYRIDDWPKITHTDYRTARDMWTLLAPRIRNLERHGIVDSRIRAMQQEGMEALTQAETALSRKRYDGYQEAAGRSWALAARVYTHVDKTQKDVLFGVLFYIALFVPFAFCMERLLFSFSDIHKRIVAFLLLLLGVIAVIYRVHPAFQLAYSPTVVILAFFIMGLSLMVTLIIFSRFEQEMVLLQRRAADLRAEEISRWKAFIAAFFLGVGNLRRRRLRTALTCITLVILTFTIMSFTTVATTRHHARILYAPNSPYPGFLFKNVNWRDLPPEAFAMIETAAGSGADAAPRAWLESDDRSRSRSLPVRFGDRVYEAKAMVGLSIREPQVTGLDRVLVRGRWFGPEDRYAVLLPSRMADTLGIDWNESAETRVSIGGIAYRVAGVFSEKALEETLDLDGESVTPVVFPNESSALMTEEEMDVMESGEDVETFQSRYQHVPAGVTIIVPYETLMARGGRLKAVAVRPEKTEAMEAAARKLVDRFGLTLFSGEREGTFLCHAGDTLAYSGAPHIVIPVAISILIVLNTMIGSVVERKREIAVYTSVGLAPNHVSFLFIAEALALGVLSVVMGYLLAQVSAGLFAGTALWKGITVNYSSLAGVASMMLVILVVLVSAIYPSRVAADIAIPDVNRSWSLPDLQDNRMVVVLPFLVKHHEHHSIAGFLFSYFHSRQDVSHGLFSTGDMAGQWVPLESSPPMSCVRFKVRVWLAPFDFGIMQQAEIRLCPSSGNPGFLEIEIRLVRETGEINSWKRINRPFINDIRKQLLIWRSLDARTRREYAAELLRHMGRGSMAGTGGSA